MTTKTHKTGGKNMKKDSKKATVQAIDEMMAILKEMKKNVKNVKLEDINAERFLTGEISKTWYDVKSLDNRTSCFF